MINQGQIRPGSASNEHILQKMAWQEVNLPMEVRNAFANWYLCYASERGESAEGMIRTIRAAVGRISCISKMEKKSGPILICGSGSSFNTMADKFKGWPMPVMCSTSQASTLVKYGRVPDYVTCLDPRAAPEDELAAPDWGDAKFVGHVSVPNEYIVKWLVRARGPIHLGRIMLPDYDWYTHHLGQGYPWIRHVMMPLIDSSASMIGMATWLGYNPIYLIGIDYGGPRFDRYEWDYKTSMWKEDRVTSKVDTAKIGDHAVRSMAYSTRGTLLSAFMQIHNPAYKQRIYNLSDRSVITQFPQMAIEEATKEPPEYDRDAVGEDIECALSTWETFLVPVQMGFGIDYLTYLTPDEEKYAEYLYAHNSAVRNNLKRFDAMEKQHMRPASEMIKSGQVSIEAGQLLIHGAEEFGAWDWHSIKEIDVPAVLARRKYLIAEAERRGYTQGSPDVATDEQTTAFRRSIVEDANT